MKKTTFKRIAASIAALCICSMAVAPVVASAASIKINDNTSDNVTIIGKTFNAYKIFDAEYLGDAAEADGGQSAYEYTIVSAWRDTVIDALGIADDSTDAQIISALTAIDNNSADAQDFAQYLANNIPSGVQPAKSITVTADDSTIEDLDDGYYMIKDVTTSDSTTTSGAAISAIMLNTTTDDNATVTLKADAPTIDKKIWDGTGTLTTGDTLTVSDTDLYEANTANMYETVTYYVKSNVPNTEHYDNYHFIMVDQIDKGLTFDQGSVKVYVDGALYSADNYTVTFSDSSAAAATPDGHIDQMVITFNDMENLGTTKAGSKIEVVYTATVNLDAEVGETGNVNGIELVYSNDPSVSSGGTLTDTDDDDIPDIVDDDDDNDGTPDGDDGDTPDEPTNEDSIVETPEEEVITYLTTLTVNKTDGNGAALAGATFKFYKDADKTQQIKLEQVTLDDGTKVYCVSDNGTTDAITTVTTAAGDESIVIYGLDQNAIIYVEEVAAPATYNKIDSLIEFKVVSCTVNNTALPLDYDCGGIEDKCTWTYSIDDKDDANVTATANSNLITIANNQGGLFPSTGGIGTTIFTVVGVSLMAGAAGAFAIKRKAMNK